MRSPAPGSISLSSSPARRTALPWIRIDIFCQGLEAVGLGCASQSTVSGWLSRTIKEEKERKKTAAFDLWMACETQEEIAEGVGVPRETVRDWERGFGEKLVSDNPPNWHNFDPPIYNIWKRQKKSNHVDHFGKSEPEWSA